MKPLDPQDRYTGALTIALVFVALVLLALSGGCTPWIRQVKVPVPVPCLERAEPLAPVPLASTGSAEAAALGQAGNWAVLADRVAASIRLLAADRLRLQASVEGCARVSAEAKGASPPPPGPRPGRVQ